MFLVETLLTVDAVCPCFVKSEVLKILYLNFLNEIVEDTQCL
jgi:hypothetical protein